MKKTFKLVSQIKLAENKAGKLPAKAYEDRMLDKAQNHSNVP